MAGGATPTHPEDGLVRRRRLLTLGHSYAVTANRRLAHEMARVGGESWEVVTVAPQAFRAAWDLRPVTLTPEADEPNRLVAVPAYLTRWVHVFAYGRRLKQTLAEGWDVVHCWEEPYVLAGAQVARWTPRSARLVYRSAQSLPKRYPPPFDALERYCLERASGWICSGRLVEQNLRQRPLYGRLPARRIPLGVDVQRFRPDPERRRAVHARLGWSDGGGPVVGFLGRLATEKGLGLLLRALGQVMPPWRALVVGAGPLEAEVRRWALRWPERIRLLTDVVHADVPEYLAAMDLLCAPSQTTPAWKEQFGRMIVEAFACGVPVVGSDSGEIPFVIGDSGVVVEEADERGWVAALEHLLTDEALRGELGERGLARARAEFAWPVVAAQYLSFFDRLVDGG